jgi:hypothetical protein
MLVLVGKGADNKPADGAATWIRESVHRLARDRGRRNSARPCQPTERYERKPEQPRSHPNMSGQQSRYEKAVSPNRPGHEVPSSMVPLCEAKLEPSTNRALISS